MLRLVFGFTALMLACSQEPSAVDLQIPKGFARDPACPRLVLDGAFSGWSGAPKTPHEYADVCGGFTIPTTVGTLYVNNDPVGAYVYLLADWRVVNVAPSESDDYDRVMLRVKNTVVEVRLYWDQRLDILCDGVPCTTQSKDATRTGTSPDQPEQAHEIYEVRLAAEGIACTTSRSGKYGYSGPGDPVTWGPRWM